MTDRPPLARGEVSRLATPGYAYVRVPSVAGSHEFGPCPIVDPPATTSAAGDPAHSHNLPTLAVGQRVVVGFLGGGNPVIFGRLP